MRCWLTPVYLAAQPLCCYRWYGSQICATLPVYSSAEWVASFYFNMESVWENKRLYHENAATDSWQKFFACHKYLTWNINHPSLSCFFFILCLSPLWQFDLTYLHLPIKCHLHLPIKCHCLKKNNCLAFLHQCSLYCTTNKSKSNHSFIGLYIHIYQVG